VPGRRANTPEEPTKPVTTAVQGLDTPSKAISEKSQAKADWRIIIQLARNVWPKNSPGVKVRVGGALGLLVAGKLLNVQVPFFFKYIVDSLNVPITESTTVWVLAGASIAGCKCWRCKWYSADRIDGIARILTTLFAELRNAVFASVAQGAIRKVAKETFEHLLHMDMKFHLERQTGGLTRAIDRGTKWVYKYVCGMKAHFAGVSRSYFRPSSFMLFLPL
jgi:ATP-binding cassette subfamily B (MDR/TAP) protein 7